SGHSSLHPIMWVPLVVVGGSGSLSVRRGFGAGWVAGGAQRTRGRRGSREILPERTSAGRVGGMGAEVPQQSGVGGTRRALIVARRLCPSVRVRPMRESVPEEDELP